MDAFEAFPITEVGGSSGEAWMPGPLAGISAYRQVVAAHGACALAGGLYRFHDGDTGLAVSEALATGFPEHDGRAVPFAFDWMGRSWSLDLAAGGGVLLHDFGSGEVWEVPYGFEQFHGQAFVDDAEHILGLPLWRAWRELGGGAEVAHHECLGLRRPLFLGGTETVDDLERQPVSVYWSFSAQLWASVRDLPAGTPVSDLAVEDR